MCSKPGGKLWQSMVNLHGYNNKLMVHMYSYIVKNTTIFLIVKGKPFPLQAWSGPEGSRKLRFPDFMTTAQDGGKVVSLKHCKMASLLPCSSHPTKRAGGGKKEERRRRKKSDLQPSITYRRHCSYLDVQSESIRNHSKWIQLANDII